MVATTVNNLGWVLWEMGDLSGAKACFEGALAIGVTGRGTNDPTVATYSENLNLLLQDIGGAEVAQLCSEENSTAYGDAPGEMIARG
jgi:hypothetical protein